jgi:tetratricopeptide (TPR) repeat protein
MTNPPLGQQTPTLQQAIDLGVEHHNAGRLSEAESIYQQILQADPNQPVALNLLGVIAHTVGQYDSAVDLITKALTIRPDYVEAHVNLGVSQKELGRFDEAVASYRKALAIKPDIAEALSNLGWVLTKLGTPEDAVICLRQALTIKPDYALAHNNLGIALKDLGNLDEAIAHCRNAIAINPNFAEAHGNLGRILASQGNLNEAVESYHNALAIKPDYAEALHDLGIAFQTQSKPEEALESYYKALAIKPDFAYTHNNMGFTFRDLGKLEEALTSFDKAIAVKPDYANAYANKAMTLLLKGDFASGLPLYEWRWKFGLLNENTLAFPQPLWLGKESLSGKTILLYSEQGLGDAIQFCRYAKLVSGLGARVILGVEKRLARLLKQLDGVAEIIPSGGALSPFDYQCPMLSLPLAFKTRLETIPNQAAYLGAEAQRIQRWASVIGKGGFKIGICWQGGAGEADVGRSFPLALFREISKIPNVRLISLHKGDGLAQLENLPSDMAVESLGADFDAGPDAFLDTAAVMTLCDLIITSDTAVAHLAGALGLPTWVALRHIPDWRWLLDRDDSPWYPSIKLYRQPRPGDWQSVFEDMAAAIQAERVKMTL